MTVIRFAASPVPEIRLPEIAESGRFGGLVTPGPEHLKGFAAMVAESVAASQSEQYVADAWLRRGPSYVLRRFEAERFAGVVRVWVVSGDAVLATGTVRIRGSKWFGNLGYFVRPTRRGEGVGRALMRDLVAVARGIGLDEPKAAVDTGNTASRRAVEAAGGTLVDRITELCWSRCVYVFRAHEPESQRSSYAH
jgi:predicted acetyltransferase